MFLNQSDVHKLNPWFRKRIPYFRIIFSFRKLAYVNRVALKRHQEKKKTEILPSGFNHKMWGLRQVSGREL